MGLRVERIGNEPILVMHFSEPFDGQVDVNKANDATNQLRKEISGTIYRIENTLDVNLNFSQIVAGLSASNAAKPGSMGDPDVYGMFVGRGEISALTAQSFAQNQYGGKETHLFNTVEDAINHARNHMKNR